MKIKRARKDFTFSYSGGCDGTGTVLLQFRFQMVPYVLHLHYIDEIIVY